MLYYGIAAPAGTPRPIIERINKEMRAIITSDEISKRIVADGGDPAPATPEEYAAKIARDEAKWERPDQEDRAGHQLNARTAHERHRRHLAADEDVRRATMRASRCIRPMGEKPRGLVVFYPDKRMMSVLCDGRSELPPGETVREYNSYCGNYDYDGTNLVTRVDASASKDRVGGEQKRFVHFDRRAHGADAEAAAVAGRDAAPRT